MRDSRCCPKPHVAVLSDRMIVAGATNIDDRGVTIDSQLGQEGADGAAGCAGDRESLLLL